MDNFDKLRAIMSKVLRIATDDISIGTSMDTVKSWDSLKHMNLVIAIEREFSIDLEDEEIEILTNVETILAVIQEKK